MTSLEIGALGMPARNSTQLNGPHGPIQSWSLTLLQQPRVNNIKTLLNILLILLEYVA
jgi:hypothetical protein